MNCNGLRTCVLTALLAVPLMANAAAAQDFSGRWDTNMGALRMDQGGDHVSGSYEMKGGRVEGHVDNNTLRGIWTQDVADHCCFEERMGTHYWGHFRFHLTEDGGRFFGHWSYCEDERGSGGDWNGTRRWHHHRFRDRF